LGWQAERFKDLDDSNSLFWNIGPGIRWNLFDAGKIRSNIEVQDARQEQALVQYRQAVLASMEDVENALVNYDREQTRRVALASAVDSNRRAVDLANQLYSRGLVDFLNVQEAQRSLLAAEDQLAQSDTAVSSNLVALYKALGGGWEAMEEPKSD
jgi:outer membrane protein TolC